MVRISRVISEIEDKLTDLRENLKAVKDWARYLEEENQNLRRELSACSARLEQLGQTGMGKANLEKEQQNLRKLYEKGFHICPYNFGHWRTQDCLFCLGFLKNTLERQEQSVGGNE